MQISYTTLVTLANLPTVPAKSSADIPRQPMPVHAGRFGLMLTAMAEVLTDFHPGPGAQTRSDNFRGHKTSTKTATKLMLAA
jgi:hypothetical protein